MSDDGGRDEIAIGLVVTDAGEDAALVSHAVDVVVAPGVVGADEDYLHLVEVVGLENFFLECEAEASYTVWNMRSDEGDISGYAGQPLCLAHALVAASDDYNRSLGEGKSNGKIIHAISF